MATIENFNDLLAFFAVLSIMALITADSALNRFTVNDTFIGFIISVGTLVFNYYYRKVKNGN
ncbi:hypothetical protein CL614_04045 [archaeon]|jgi:hypothetical protein|nr:hypothetical protein [archaeon]|tara:strand:+ start:341 stop:526 length:186 start_codon:yes stop_codon:yes gene_type:complete